MNPLHRRPQARQRTRIRAEAPEPRTGGPSGEVALRLYDPIDDWGGYWGVSAKEFADVLDGLPEDTASIRLLINCPGGMVWEGLAILNLLRAHPARVTAVVEGIAASAASFIAAGVDELHMARNSELFVHRAWGFAVGNAQTMTWAAQDLERHDRNLASIYQSKAGGDIEDWLAAMTEETTYGHDEAVAIGLADRVLGDDGAAAAAEARARFDLSVLASHRSGESTPTPAAAARGGHPTGRSSAVAFTDEQLATMRTNLGLAPDASEDTIVEAMTEALNEQAEETPAPQQTGGETGSEVSAPEPVAARLPDGVVAIDAAQLEALQASARRGDEARAQQERDVRMALVNAAVADGRIPAARRDAWATQLEADPGAANTLASLAPGLVPVEARGHDTAPSAQADPAAGDDYWFPGIAHPTAATQGS